MREEPGDPLALAIEVLAQSGSPVADLLSPHGLTETTVRTERLSPLQYGELYRNVIDRLEQVTCRAERRRPMSKEAFDLLCSYALHGPDLRGAIQRARAFCSVLEGKGGVLSLREAHGTAWFEMDSKRRKRQPCAYLVDQTGLASYHMLFSWLLGEVILVTGVQLASPRGFEHLASQFFDQPVICDAKTYGFGFEASWLSRPVIRSIGELEALLPIFPFDLMMSRAIGKSLSEQAQLLMANLARNRRPIPSAAQMARFFNTSEATFRRRLKSEGHGYQRLKDECLRTLALEWLQRNDLSIEQIGLRLGFSEASAFRRAFKQWTGKAPSAFRL